MSPMRRELYPPNWDEIARSVKERADWRCELCGRQCRRPGEPFDTHRRTLTVAHYHDPDPANVDPANLKALCAPCHLRHDVRRRAGHRARSTRAAGPTLPGLDPEAT